MTEKKRHSSRRRSIWNFLTLVPHVFSLVRHTFYQIKAETFFTIKNIILLLMLALMLACLLTATWVSLLAILFVSLLKLQWSFYAAVGLVMLINIIFLLVIGIWISKIKTRVMMITKRRGQV